MYRFGLVASLIGILLVSVVPIAGAASIEGATDNATVLTIGHRGASGYAPERTFPANDRALRLGADYIEQDLQLTKDGVPVVPHDETLDRTARGPEENCTGSVVEKPLEQIKTCEVGSWFNEENPEYAREGYVGSEIPTLEEIFPALRIRRQLLHRKEAIDEMSHQNNTPLTIEAGQALDEAIELAKSYTEGFRNAPDSYRRPRNRWVRHREPKRTAGRSGLPERDRRGTLRRGRTVRCGWIRSGVPCRLDHGQPHGRGCPRNGDGAGGKRADRRL